MTLVMDDLVARAARFMDEERPGWAEKINKDTLTMIDADLCVAGQNGLNWETVGTRYSVAESIDVDDGQSVFASQRVAWIREIDKRVKV